MTVSLRATRTRCPRRSHLRDNAAAITFVCLGDKEG